MAFILLSPLSPRSKSPTDLSGHVCIENSYFLYTGSYLIYFSTLALCRGSLVAAVNIGLHPFKIVLHYTDEPFLNPVFVGEHVGHCQFKAINNEM